MLHLIQRLFHEAIKYGPGQAIIAISAWTYVFILILVVIYYAILALIKFLFSK